MRRTIEFDDDVAAAVAQLRSKKRMGASEAVNHLIRSGLIPRDKSTTFRQSTHEPGALLDISNVAETLELLEGPDTR